MSYLIIKDAWESCWVKPKWKKNETLVGDHMHITRKWNGDPNDKGVYFLIFFLFILITFYTSHQIVDIRDYTLMQMLGLCNIFLAMPRIDCISPGLKKKIRCTSL